MTCEQRRDLLLLYVTDALEAAETLEMRNHLQRGCAECAGYLAEAQAVIHSIPLGLDPVTPPPHLKQKLLERIAAEESATKNKTSIRSNGPEDIGYSSPLRLFRYLIPTAVAAGLAIVCTRSIMMQRINDMERSQRTTIIESTSQQNALQGQIRSQTQVVDMLRSPGLKLIPLKATDHQPNAIANLLWDQNKNQWALLTKGMTPAAPGQTYELWFVTEAGAKIAAGTFDVDASGTGSLKVPIPLNIGDLKLAAVTNEKAGGAKQPTGDFQVLGNVD